jgi:hypothetical protein
MQQQCSLHVWRPNKKNCAHIAYCFSRFLASLLLCELIGFAAFELLQALLLQLQQQLLPLRLAVRLQPTLALLI